MKRTHLLTLLAAGHGFQHWLPAALGPALPFISADLRLSFTQIGILMAGRSFCSGITSAGMGLAVDVLGGSRWILAACVAAMALFYGGMSFTTGFLVLLPIFWLSGFPSHAWHPPSMGLLSDLFPNQKGFAFGVHGTGANIGHSLSPFIAGYMLSFMDWRMVFRVNTIPFWFMAVLLAVYLPNIRLPQAPKAARDGWLSQIRSSLLKNPSLLALCVLSGVRAAVHGGIYIFLPLLLVKEYGAGPAWVGVVLGVFTGSAILPETLMGYLSDRFSSKSLLVIGIATGGISVLSIPVVGAGPLLLVPLALIGAFVVSLRAVVFAYGLEIVPSHLGGSVVGMLYTTNQIFSGTIPLVAGLLSDQYGLSAAFWIYGGICLAALGLFLITMARSR